MICVAISDKDPNKCLAILDTVEMAEIRLDLTEYDFSAIEEVFAHPTPKIATCRADATSIEIQRTKLIKAIECGANYVDIEIEVPAQACVEIIECAKSHNCKLIISYHNFVETPGMKELFTIVDNCYSRGADIAKIATMANNSSDNARLMALYTINKPIVALGMGEMGKVTRLISPLLGAEFTFASQDDGTTTAPGQISYTEMKDILERINSTIKK